MGSRSRRQAAPGSEIHRKVQSSTHQVQKLKNMSLLVVGSVAYDEVETPFGKCDKMLGGSGSPAANTTPIPETDSAKSEAAVSMPRRLRYVIVHLP